MNCLNLTLIFVVFGVSLQRNKDEWKTRVVYQLLTDRFARSDGGESGCDLSNYCGGTFQGITNNLDYITSMGFNAIWISPVVENTDRGYHGYHMKNLYELNPHFGSEQDLKDLVDECHRRDVWVMVDVVANHAGMVGTDYSKVYPFNDASHYHNPCDIEQDDFIHNQWKVENCRLAGLPDFKQENEFVRVTLLDWIRKVIQKFKFDGIRIDTVPEVPVWFWQQFARSAGVYQVGEVFDGRLDYVANYQNNALDGVLNYPLYFALKDVFVYGNSMYKLESTLQQIDAHFKEPSALGVFFDNHDNARFLSMTNRLDRFANSLGFSVLADGIPIVYYGSEQLFRGGNDPANREPMWGHFNRQSQMYKFVSTLVKLRTSQRLWEKKQVQRFADDHFYAFTRGNILALFTNTDQYIQRTITYHEFSEGTKLCNVFDPTGDCIYIRDNKIEVSIKADMKVYLVADSFLAN